MLKRRMSSKYGVEMRRRCYTVMFYLKDEAKYFGGDNIFAADPPDLVLSRPSEPKLPFQEQYSSI
jgi:hypothetical protein